MAWLMMCRIRVSCKAVLSSAKRASLAAAKALLFHLLPPAGPARVLCQQYFVSSIRRDARASRLSCDWVKNAS